MTEIGNRRNGQTGQPTPFPAIECPGCGALHALIDRLTVAVERVEVALPRPEATAAEPAWTSNPDGIPDTEEK